MAERNLTQQRVADAAEVSQAAVFKWLNGSSPGATELFNLASKNGVTVEWFLESGDLECKNNVDICGTPDSVVGVRDQVPTWAELKKDIIRFTAKRGAKAALARKIGVSRQALGNWLADEAESSPSADLTLELFRTVRRKSGK